ncbi:GUN4 domain-containing protein, partial [Okeania sp. SIO2G5]|uniref:GUN4 domain-containing protein n=1 Tax=Okeania sp. SIO2G5 TaxID=2607796 RepID=UPI0013C06B72
QESPARLRDPALKHKVENATKKLRIFSYSNLENYLKKQQWRSADEETYRILIRLVNKKDGESFDKFDFPKIPLDDFKIIDWLWRRHSSNKFGFEIQNKIYIDQGGNRRSLFKERIINKFGDKMLWRKDKKWIKYQDIDYSSDLLSSDQIPQGYLPIAAIGRVGNKDSISMRWVSVIERVMYLASLEIFV